MVELLLILTVIALLDSLSMLPLAVLPMTVALGSARPWTLAAAFVAGVYVAYFVCGIPLLVGAEALFDYFGAYFERLWNRPNALELGIQICIGILFMLSAWFLWRAKRSRPRADASPSASPGAMFFLGATLVVLGIPGAVPYLAAIERIVNYDPDWAAAFGYLVFYNFVFIVPLLCLMALRYVLAERADGCFQALAKFCLGVVPRLTAILFLILGLVMVADGIGWFCGYPLLPVSP